MTMQTTRISTLVIAAVTALIGLYLVADRNGVLAWLGLLIGVGMLVKIWRRPSRIDLALAVGLAAVPVLAWFGTVQYVISTWESGEVVELTIETAEGTHNARLWVMDIDAQPVVYYDAEPHVAASLLAGTPLQFTRGGETRTRIPHATRVEALPEVRANKVLDAMQTKYGDRNHAADIWYVMLGRPSDRVAVVVELTEEKS